MLKFLLQLLTVSGRCLAKKPLGFMALLSIFVALLTSKAEGATFFTLPNGDFEAGIAAPSAGPLGGNLQRGAGFLQGWTSSGISKSGTFNNGFATVVREGRNFSHFDTRGHLLPGQQSALIRSGGFSPVDSVGILTSPEFIIGKQLRFLALSETNFLPDPVTFEVHLLGQNGFVPLKVINDEELTQVWEKFPVNCVGDPTLCDFSTHTIDTSRFAGEKVRVQFRQHTNSPGDGFFTLIDNVQTSNSSPNSFEISPQDLVLDEGEDTAINLSAFDANPESLNFFFTNGLTGEQLNLTDARTSGKRSVPINLGPFLDEVEFTNTAYAQDGNGEVSNTVIQTVTVRNVAPLITDLSVPAVVNEGDVFNFSASHDDPGKLDVISYSWDLNGDGTFGDYTAPAGLYSYPNDGNYRGGLSISDGDGGFGFGNFDVTVQNVAPKITQLTGDLTVKSNEIFSFFADAFDPGKFDELTFAWDLDDDGQFDDFFDDKGQWIFKDPGTFKVSLRVSDGDGGVAEQSFSVTATPDSFPPNTPKFSAPKRTIKEGQTVDITLSATDIDPEPLKFFLNDELVGTDPATSGIRSISTTLGPFVDEGTFKNTAYVKDSTDKESEIATQTVTVQNVAPTITQITSDLTINEGSLFNFAALAFDPGVLDVLSYEWDLDGDGFYGDFIGQTGQHVFPQNGSYKLGLRVSDEDGGVTEGGFNVDVQNVAPSITQLTNDLTVKPNELFDFFADAIDPGILDQLSFDWDLNSDGVFNDFTGKKGQWLFTEPGLFDIALRVSDGDGGEAFQSFTVISVNEPSVTVPEPSSAFGVLSFSLFGLSTFLKRNHRKKDNQSILKTNVIPTHS